MAKIESKNTLKNSSTQVSDSILAANQAVACGFLGNFFAG